MTVKTSRKDISMPKERTALDLIDEVVRQGKDKELLEGSGE